MIAAAEQGQAATSQDWQSEALSNLAREEYRFTARGPGVWGAPNRAQGLGNHVDRNGIEWSSRSSGFREEPPTWSVRLETVGFGRGDEIALVESHDPVVEANRAEIDHGPLVEWFVNDERGVEQGWTIPQRPDGEGPLVIRIAVGGNASLSLGPEGRSGVFTSHAGEELASYGALMAWDSTMESLEVRMRSTSSGFELHVDDSAATYPIVVDPLLTTAQWAVTSQKGSHFGFSVSTAGDVNGDGYDDVIVGAFTYDNGQSAEGRAFVYLGSANGLASSHVWSAESDQSTAFFGHRVSGAGDINGDGFDDILVGAPLFDNGEDAEGRAYLYLGTPTGPESAPAWTAEPNQSSAFFPQALSSAGDINGDGYDDVVAGSDYYQNSPSPTGRVFVYHGSATGLSPTPSWTAQATTTKGFGASASTAGDVNGDGYDDLIVGAEGSIAPPPSQPGKVYVYHGSSTGLGSHAVWTADSDVPTGFFGRSVACAGDVNADGFSDIIVGEPDASAVSGGAIGFGRAHVYHGSSQGLEALEAWRYESDQLESLFGFSVAGAGDLDGDGYSDVVVGAHGYDKPPYTDTGRAYVFRGSASGVEVTPAWTQWPLAKSGAFFGHSVAGAGDINGDGLSDLIIGAPDFNGPPKNIGRAAVYHGSRFDEPVSYCTAGNSSSNCKALISAAGSPSASASSGFTMTASSVEGGKHGVFLFGTNGRQAIPWTSGNIFTKGISFQCVAPPASRTAVLRSSGTSGQCTGSFTTDLNALWCPSCPKSAANPGAGSVVQAQLWYRDQMNASTAYMGTLLSDAIEFLVAP